MTPTIGMDITIRILGGAGKASATLLELGPKECVIRTSEGKRLSVKRQRILGSHLWDDVPPSKTRAESIAVAQRKALIAETREHAEAIAPPSTTLARAVPKPAPPARSERYMAFVRARPCCSCGAASPSDPHHYGGRGMAQKTDDFRTVPLCRRCHDIFHDRGVLPGMDRATTRIHLLTKQNDLLVLFLRTELEPSGNEQSIVVESDG